MTIFSRLRLLGATALTATALVSLGLVPAAHAAPTTTAPSAAHLANPDLLTPRLASVDNFRDLAGPALLGYPAAGGKHVRHRVVYRSNALTPDKQDLATLNTLGIRRVYDLRTTSEVTAKPDTVPAGAKYTRVNIMGDDSQAAAGFDYSTLTPESARQFLIEANRNFVTDPAQRAELGRLLRSIAAQPGPVLYHYTAGKDRTGWTSALLLSNAGVSHSDIMSNYLLTNKYSAKSIDAAAQAFTKQYGPTAGAGARVLLGVFPEALQAGLDQAVKDYGSIDGYLRKGLGLDGKTLNALRAELTY
ncbi:tyrosine-protein phosphatase [Gordonia sp. (in: high G+C Gram-positive bacteria)]|uniref:tyrosine-protein phosphatase n=1 Tax=unclassified Gordonia (in: high G+C Gram-positive bacteria) TaxID=2657482 RepID=UPI002618A0CB|nr:tyrosine-protein phosphatase [Gordonia sp. (in: high G+C Gram-positive bacteria)]